METILLILKAIPALKDAVERFIKYYIEVEYQGMKTANREGIKYAIEKHDQRKIEEAINSSKAGIPSGHSGSTFHDELPGVGMSDKG